MRHVAIRLVKKLANCFELRNFYRMEGYLHENFFRVAILNRDTEIIRLFIGGNTGRLLGAPKIKWTIISAVLETITKRESAVLEKKIQHDMCL